MNQPETENQTEFFFTITSRDEIRDRIQVDEICSLFETEWTQRSVGRIEKLAQQVIEKNRSELICELLAIDFEMRRVSDRQLSLENYVSQLPQYSQEVIDTIQVWLSDTKNSTPLIGKGVEDIPARLGDYRIVKLIGQGGSGAVYEAVQESLDRPVAIKTLNYSHVASQLSRFQQEARAVAMLHHTNIVEVYGSGIDNGVAYFAMQLIDGNGLDQLIDRSRRDSEIECVVGNDFLLGVKGRRNVARIGLGVARALGHAHQFGVLHRDVKPSNLLIDQNENTWVSDFGLAKLRNEDSNHTLDGSVVGTMRYVPPEAFSGQWSERSDVYSLGVTLYELLALEPAFSADDHPQLIKQITLRDRQVKRLRQNDDSIPIDLETIVSKAMSFEPADRFQSADEMGDELERYLDGLPIHSRPLPVVEKVYRWSKRKPTAAALALLVCAVAFIGLPIAIWLWLSASSALEVAESEREHATQMQTKAENLFREAEAARYSNGTMLASSYIEDGRTGDAKRLFNELAAERTSPPRNRTAFSDRWELDFLKQKLDTSRLTLKGDMEHRVWHVAIRPDDRQIATVHNDGTDRRISSDQSGEVILWNPENGDIDHVLKVHGSRVYGCAYSHDGKQLATIGFKSSLDEKSSELKFFRGSISLWDVASGKRTKMVSLSGSYNTVYLHGLPKPVLPGVAFSDNDEKLVSWPQEIEVFETKTLKSVWNAPRYLAATVLPNDRVLGAVSDGQSLNVLDLNTGERLNSIKAKTAGLSQFTHSSSGDMMVHRSEKSVRIWDSVEAMDKHRMVSIPDVYWTCLSPNGSQIAYSTRKGDVRIRPVRESDDRLPRVLLGHNEFVTSGAFSNDGKWLVTGSADGTAKVWDLVDSEPMFETRLSHAKIAAISFSSDSSEILYCSRKTQFGPRQANKRYASNAGAFSISGPQSSRVTLETTYRAFYPRNDFAFSRDGAVFAAPVAEPELPKNILGYSETGRVGVWDTENWNLRLSIDTKFSQTYLSAWSKDNQILAIGGLLEGVQKIQFHLIEEDSSSLIGEVAPDNMDIFSLAFYESDQFAVGSSSEILIWKLSNADGKADLNSFSVGAPKRIQIGGSAISLDFSPDGSRLASADYTNDLLQVFDIETGEMCYERSGPRKICCVRYSPCGKRIALSGYDSIVHLCDAEFGFRLLSLVGTDEAPGTFAINSKVVFSPDGRRIATNNWRGEIAFWEIGETDVESASDDTSAE